jgi:hypothetical protein
MSHSFIQVIFDNEFYELLKVAKYNLEDYILECTWEERCARECRLRSCTTFLGYIVQSTIENWSKEFDRIRDTDRNVYNLMESLVNMVGSNNGQVPGITLNFNVEDYEDILYWHQTSKPMNLDEIRRHIDDKVERRKKPKWFGWF